MLTIHYDANLCVMTKFSSLISGKWKPIILHLIEREVNRFSLMQSHMPAISKKILTEQLRELETDGLIYREELKAKAPKVEIIAWSMNHMKEDIPDELVKVFVNTYPDLSNNLLWLHTTV